MLTKREKISPVNQELTRHHPQTHWLRLGIAGVVTLALGLLLLGSFAGAGRAAQLQFLAPTILKSSATSLVEANNTIAQAVAGELVTVTVEFNVPSGETIYDASPRVLLQDGLVPIGSSPAWGAMVTGTTTALRVHEALAARNGALVIFPTEGITVIGPATLTRVVYAVRTQRTYVGTPAEIAHNAALRVQAVLRYCASAPGCGATVAVSNDDVTAQVTAIQPSLNATYGASTYLDADGLGAGGGQVRLIFNTANASGRPDARDVVFTATLGAGLTHAASSGGSGAGAGTVSTVGNITYVAWNVPVSLAAGASWQAVVTATLPSPFTIGREFTYASTVRYDTFTGAMPYEGRYTTTGATQTLRPGVSITTKTSVPSTGAVTMSDRITYTVTFRQAPNTQLQSPYYEDILPRGFHYVSGTLAVANATLLTQTVSEGPVSGTGSAARYFEKLRWTMDTLPPTTAARLITAQYVTLNTGRDYRGTLVWESAADLAAARNTIETAFTGAMLYWTPPSGFTYGNLGSSYTNLATRANPTTVNVIQPFLANAQFAALRDGAAPVEISDVVLLKFRARNSSATPGVPAHQLQICDTLPAGFEYVTTFSCTPVGGAPACPTFTSPAPNSTGTVCWDFAGLPRTDATTKYHEISYQARVSDATQPGVYTNRVFVQTYNSKAGVVEGQRDYGAIPAALPTPVNCGASCITVLGLAGNKHPWATNVAPGSLLTYTLAFTDTSVATDYTGLVAVDTYDSLLTFVNATPAPDNHNTGARQLTWNLGSVPTGGGKQIVLTMRVASVIENRYTLTNTMTWDSDQTALHTVSKVTPIDVSSLHVRMSGPATTYAGGTVAYTVVYSNTGSWNNAPVTLTLNYDQHLTYMSASPLTPVPSTNNVFVTTLPNNGVNKTLTITLTAKAPLPYTLAEIYSSVGLASPGAPAQNSNWTVTLRRPIFEFSKTGPAYAPSSGGTIQYAFSLRNTGNYTATGLVITDTWDTGTNFQSGVGWTPSGSYAVYNIASLAPGATATINPLSVVVNTVNDNYLNRADLRSAQTSVQETSLLIWAPSIQLAKSAYPNPAFPGRVLTYTLTYTNVGGITISNAVITDTLPADFSYQGRTVDGAGCSAAWQFNIVGQVATWRCTTLNTPAAGQLKIWGVVAAAAEGTWLENMAESDGAVPIPRRPMDKPLRTLVARPWLRVAKIGAPTHPVAPGDRVTYTLTYENYGTYPAYNVVIKDQLPSQLTFAGCDAGCSHNAGLVTWNIGLVPTDTIRTVMVYATVKAGTHGQTAVNSNYTIENTTVWQRLLPSETEQGAPVNTSILNPQLTLTKAAAPPVVQAVGDTIVYTLTYQNTGGGFLHNVVITDVLNLYTAFLSASVGCNHDDSAAGGVVTCQLDDLANGASRQAIIRVRVLPGLIAGDTIPNQAQGDTTETAPTTSNTTTVWYQVSGAPQIAVAPTSLNYLVKVGASSFDALLVISNTGQVPLNWAVAENPSVDWLSQAPTNGPLTPGAHATVTLTFNPAGLPAGDHTTTLVFTSGGNIVNVLVTLRVRDSQLAVSPMTLEYTVKVGAANFTAPLHITNTGEVPLTWSLAEDPNATWLDQSASTGNLAAGASATVTLTFKSASLAANNYTTTLRITGGSALQNVTVTLTVASYRVYLPLTIRQ